MKAPCGSLGQSLTTDTCNFDPNCSRLEGGLYNSARTRSIGLKAVALGADEDEEELPLPFPRLL